MRRAEKLIEYAATRGCVIDFNHVYGTRPLPRWVAVDSDDVAGAVAQPAEGDPLLPELVGGNQEPAHG